MKKLMTILVVFALCGVAMAKKPTSYIPTPTPTPTPSVNSTTFGPDLETGKYIYEKGLYTPTTDYTSNLTMNYTSYGTRAGQAYFTTMSSDALAEYNATNNTTYKTVVVQFLGTDLDRSRTYLSNQTENVPGRIVDYGIYLIDNDEQISTIPLQNQILSVKDGNSFALKPDQDFGVYYKTSTGREWYSTVDYVGTWDPDSHEISYYDKNGVYHENENVDIRFTCAFKNLDIATQGKGFHWEFMLETTLDDPYYIVDPNDPTQFAGNDDVHIPNTPASGQPLPGTLATLLIGGLCAKTLSKKNKKH